VAVLPESGADVVGVGLILGTSMDDSVGYTMKKVTMLGYAVSQPGVILHYLRLSVWPDVLLLDYNWPIATGIWTILPAALVILTLLSASIFLLATEDKQRRMLGFLGIWFFLTLAISSRLGF
jgi:protein O-mannosyl-transferase